MSRRAAWSDDDHEQYEALMSDVLAEKATSDRLNEFERLLNDAVQAHRAWARDLERQFLRDGMRADIKRFQDRNRALVAYNGMVLSLPKVQSRITITATGEASYQRELIELWTWQEIVDKKSEELRMRQCYDARIALWDRYLALRDLCPDATNPAEAAATLGIDLDDWLAGNVA